MRGAAPYFPFVLDDSDRSRAQHKMRLGSLNAASKNTVSKGSQDKIAGLLITKKSQTEREVGNEGPDWEVSLAADVPCQLPL